jgi:hypothetical protein
MAKKTSSSETASANEEFRIGPFVLETLTTGMYEGSSNALREYVQNAYDATRSAVATGALLPGEGKVTVLLPGDDTLLIADNGIGLSSQSAWSTLTAIGASKKDRLRDAGFRGIGRLAAIAFCNELAFRTKVSGEEMETIVKFNCAALRKGMLPGSEVRNLTELLKNSVKLEINDDVDADDHYMVVRLKGLKEAPNELRSLDDIRSYLAETSPIAFDPRWPPGTEIVERAAKLKKPIETIKLFVGRSDATATEVFKAYGDTYKKARKTRATGGTTPLEKISYIRGENWWSWIGIPRDSGLLADDGTSGIRIRVKNIQVDGTSILDQLFADENESYARFNKFHVGEIHVDQASVVPNARRDGFENDQGWRNIKADIFEKVCTPLAEDAYSRSEKGKKSVDAVKTKVEKLTKDIDRYFRKPAPSNSEWANALSQVEKVRTQIGSALADADPEANLPLRVQLDSVKHLKDRLEGALEPDVELRIRRQIRAELLEQVEQILQPYLETATYSRVRKLLRERLK